MPKIVLAINRQDAMPWELVFNMNQIRRFQELQVVVSETDWEAGPKDGLDEPSAPAETTKSTGPPAAGSAELLDFINSVIRRGQE